MWSSAPAIFRPCAPSDIFTSRKIRAADPLTVQPLFRASRQPEPAPKVVTSGLTGKGGFTQPLPKLSVKVSVKPSVKVSETEVTEFLQIVIKTA